MERVSKCLLRWIVLAMMLVTAVSCRPNRDQVPQDWTQSQVDLIRRAGDRLGLPVRAERMVSIVKEGTSFMTAAAANLETIPATELPNGVNVAVAYIDSPGLRVPKGFYRLRAFADVRDVGTVPGRIQLINEQGTVAREIPATVEVHSMTVPPSAATNLTEVAVQTPGDSCSKVYVCYRCSNGHWVCYCVPFGTATG